MVEWTMMRRRYVIDMELPLPTKTQAIPERLKNCGKREGKSPSMQMAVSDDGEDGKIDGGGRDSIYIWPLPTAVS